LTKADPVAVLRLQGLSLYKESDIDIILLTYIWK